MADLRKFELPTGRGQGGRGRGGRGARGARGAKQGGAAEEKKEYIVPPEKQREFLREYVELPAKFWRGLRAGNQIRYVDGEGRFRPGGTIKIVRLKSGSRTSEEKESMILINPVTSQTWGLAWNNISKIYLLPDVSLMFMKDNLQGALQGMIANMEMIAKKLADLEGRVAACEQALGRKR